jgi:putative sigma-54 modulation protein
MNIKIQSVKFDADVKLLNFIENKINKLEQYYNNIIGAEVILKLDKSGASDNKVADIKILIPGNDLFAKRQSKTFEEAVDSASEALKKQLVKVKEKQRNK